MTEPREIPFGEIPWSDDAPGIRAREVDVDGSRWAIVEYEEGAGREGWCEDGHRGFVLRGAISYEFDDGRTAITANEGQAFLLPHAALGAGAHRGRNVASEPTRLFLIDDHSGA